MQTVTQYQITEWDSNGYIENPQSIITVIEEMYKIQRKVGTSPIIIHCRYDEVKLIKYERIWAIFLIVCLYKKYCGSHNTFKPHSNMFVSTDSSSKYIRLL